MINTYISNGSAEVEYVRNGNQIKSNKTSWSGDYDGYDGNLDIEVEENGHLKKTHIDFTNKDLANLLNIQSVEKPLYQRLKNDFLPNQRLTNKSLGKQMLLEMKKEEGQPLFPLKIMNKTKSKSKSKSKTKFKSKTNRSNRNTPKNYRMSILTPRKTRAHKYRINIH